MNINVRSISNQFQDLNWKDFGNWSNAPKIALMVILFGIICASGWYFILDDQLIELDNAKKKEQQLRADYTDRLKQSVNLSALKEQKIQVTRYVADLEKQLPDKAEMDKLLSAINDAGTNKGLQFELFKPGSVLIENYYAELPINIRISGSYHKIAGFAADLSALPRIVTLNNINLNIQSNNNGLLTMDAIAKTFRYLDKDENEKVAKLKSKEGGVSK